ncbi:unnamed protein product [Brachionus calyciflorus]|uniref:Protein kinase domain-containing protein n=1 Tax=Brachionus calyciflorus TaxID=104777 RepID=A0A814BSS3_9BILA|nr:unnamed protein product [Brachionus calyciflorus]
MELDSSKSKVLHEQSIYSLRCHFKIKKSIGFGANGKVYLAKSKYDKKYYAIKPLLKNKQSQNEINLHWLSMDPCSHIVEIKYLCSTKKHYYLILEYMHGGSLVDLITSTTRKKFTEREIAKMMYQISQAVGHLHSKGIAHRDIKLENILCTYNEHNELILKLGDFGFAKEEKMGLISTKYTAPYVAPEVLNKNNYGIGCDVWSLGVVMFVLCCGYLPFCSSISSKKTELSQGMIDRIMNGQFDRKRSKEWNKLSQEAKELILGMIQVDPDKRITINQVINSKWIQNYSRVPSTKLSSAQIFKTINIQFYQCELENEFKKMRNYEHEQKNLNFDLTDNLLFIKRMNKLKIIKEEVEEDDGEEEDQLSFYDNL